MPSLKERRQALEADLQQLVGQINRTQGAMSLLDELIDEEETLKVQGPSIKDMLLKQQYWRKMQKAQEAEAASFEPAAGDEKLRAEVLQRRPEAEMTFEPAPAANDEPIARLRPAAAPEMPSVIKFKECPICVSSDECYRAGCAHDEEN